MHCNQTPPPSGNASTTTHNTSIVDITSSPCSIWLITWSFGVDYSHMETGPLVWWKSFFCYALPTVVQGLSGYELVLSRRHFARSTCTWTVSSIPRLTKALHQSYNDGMVTLKWSAILLWLRPPLCMPTACHLSGMVNFRRTIPNQRRIQGGGAHPAFVRKHKCGKVHVALYTPCHIHINKNRSITCFTGK
jgi:hypothetical protein